MKQLQQVRTLICNENSTGGLLLCGLNHGQTAKEAQLENDGIAASIERKSFFSDASVNDFKFRNTIARWFELWGYPLKQDEEVAGSFERSILQTNWLPTCTKNMHGLNVPSTYVADSEELLEVCRVLEPRVIFFFGSSLIEAFNDIELRQSVESIFGKRHGKAAWRQKDVFADGKRRIRFRFGFQHFDRLTIVSLPHPTGAHVASDYIEAFKAEMSEVINTWWLQHEVILKQS